MLRFFPASFFDETLYSRMARYHRLTGRKDDRASLHELIGVHTHVISSELPSQLAALVARLPPEANYSAEKVIHENTPFGYFTAFVNADRRAAVKVAMSGASVSGLKMFLGLTASRLGGKNYLRYCPHCNEADLVTYGQAYWHRVHQLPGVWVCPIHEVPLYALRTEVRQLKRLKLLLPDDPDVIFASAPPALTNTQRQVVLRIARLSERVMHNTWPPPNFDNIYTVHRMAAIDCGLIEQNGRLRVGELNELIAHFSSQMPTTEEYEALQRNMPDWSLRLLRKPRARSVHPLKHIVLQGCLQACSYRTLPSRAQAERGSDQPKSNRSSIEIEYERLLEVLEVQKNTLSHAASVLGTSVTTLAVAATRVGINVSIRPKYIKEELKREVCASLRSGLSPQEVSERHGISVVSVYRILRMNPPLQRDYRQTRFAISRDAYRFRFLSSRNDKGAYAWLRRNDTAWLAEQILLTKVPVRRASSVDWSLRDRLNSQQIVQTEVTLRHIPGKPKRISRTLLLRQSGMGDTLDGNLDRLPLTYSALKCCAESLAGYQSRCLCWAFSELQKQSIYPPPRWQLLRLAGIRRLCEVNDPIVASLTHVGLDR